MPHFSPIAQATCSYLIYGPDVLSLSATGWDNQRKRHELLQLRNQERITANFSPELNERDAATGNRNSIQGAKT